MHIFHHRSKACFRCNEPDMRASMRCSDCVKTGIISDMHVSGGILRGMHVSERINSDACVHLGTSAAVAALPALQVAGLRQGVRRPGYALLKKRPCIGSKPACNGTH